MSAHQYWKEDNHIARRAQQGKVWSLSSLNYWVGATQASRVWDPLLGGKRAFYDNKNSFNRGSHEQCFFNPLAKILLIIR